MPPVTVLSSPMIAFCTVFDSVSRTTRSNGFSCASSRLPASLSPTIRKAYTRIGRRIFSAIGKASANMLCHICVCMAGIITLL